MGSVPLLPNLFSANTTPVWCLRCSFWHNKLCYGDVANQHRFLLILQTILFPGLLGQLRRVIAMIPTLLLLGIMALVGETGFGFGLLSKAPRDWFAERVGRAGVRSGLRSPFCGAP